MIQSMKFKLPEIFSPTHALWAWGLKWRSSNWFTVFVVTFAVFTDVCLPFFPSYDIELHKIGYETNGMMTG